MAISFVGSAENSAINGGDVTVTLPGGMLQNDLVIVSYGIGDNDGVNFDMAIVSPTGYTEVADLFSDDTQDASLGVFWKFMGATPDTTVVVDGLGGTDASVAAVVMVFRGVDTTTPMDVTPTTATGIDTMHPNPPSINHNNPSGVWTVIAGAAGHTLAGAGTFTFPTGYTTNAIDRGSDDTGGDVTVGMGYRSSGVSDPEDPGVMTHSGTDSTSFAWCACTIALRPAVLSPTRGRVSWAELEAPFVPTRGLVSWAEMETPLAPTRGRVSWAEVETPLAPTRGLNSWAEFEAPFAPTRGLISWAELETPDEGGVVLRGWMLNLHVAPLVRSWRRS